MTPFSLLSLDPGRKGFGWAFFSAGKLLACGVVKQPKGPRDYAQPSLEAVAANVEREIRCALDGVLPYYDHRGQVFDRCVIERMTSYPGQKAFAANDLLDLQAIAGLVAGALCPLAGVRYLTPAEWKGQTETEALIARAAMVFSVEEMAILRAMEKKYGKTLAHNGWDSALMGKVALGKRNLFP